MDGALGATPIKRPTPIRATDLPLSVWWTSVAIRFGRCDAAGIVYTPQYFDFFIAAIESWYNERLGLDYYKLLKERRLGMGYGHASCEFFAPSIMGESWDIAIIVERLGRSSVTLMLHVLVDGQERARGRLVSVATSLDTGVVIPIPSDVRAALQDYKAACDASG